jgi:hypothetical protein
MFPKIANPDVPGLTSNTHVLVNTDFNMALHVPRAPGFSSMLKDGARFFSGLDEAVLRNIGKLTYIVARGVLRDHIALVLVRRLQGVRRDGLLCLRAQRHEQDGHQPPGEVVRDERRRHDHS